MTRFEDQTDSTRGAVSTDIGLVVEGLRKQYGERLVVDGISLRVAPGEVYGLLGPNGAGKSTTIGIIATVIRPDAGSVHVAGPGSPDDVRAIRQHIGLVPQEVSLYPSLSAEDNLRFFARIHHVAPSEVDSRINQMLELSGLVDRRREPVGTFSGGMQRRLNLVCGLAHRPRVLLLDEPTVGVDPQSRERIFEMIERQARAGLSVLYTTHYMEEAERLCDRIGIIDAGRLLAEGTQQDLSARLGDERSARFAFASTPGAKLRGSLESLGASSTGDDGFVLAGADLEQRVQRLLEDTRLDGNTIRTMSIGAPSLEDLFLRLTGKELRD